MRTYLFTRRRKRIRIRGAIYDLAVTA
jgi:hypothetical protein